MSKQDSVDVKFPLSAFLSQPVFDAEQKLILNPRKFQQQYHLRLLESCFRRQSPLAKYRR
jgi:hypothetical protein